MAGQTKNDSKGNAAGVPPPLPSSRAVVYDCITGQCHKLGTAPLTFGPGDRHDIPVGAVVAKDWHVTLGRSGKRLQLSFGGGGHEIEVDGTSFEGGLLPEEEQYSLVIDKEAFFFIATGEKCDAWTSAMKNSGKNRWILHIFDGGLEAFRKWKKASGPSDFSGKHTIEGKSMLELIDEIGKRSWDDQVGVVFNDALREVAKNRLVGFYATQFKKLSAPDELPDEGSHRDPRCFLRFNTRDILAIHPSDYGDEVLGEAALKRFLPDDFDEDNVPLTKEGLRAQQFACPHCRGELPPNIIERQPHMLSIIGDSMSGKSYFLTVGVRALRKVLPAQFGVTFSDADPQGNAVLSTMIAKLFSPTQDPAKTLIAKTQLGGETTQEFVRYGNKVKLPRPFTYRINSQNSPGAAVVLYDNAGETFRPDNRESDKSNATEHMAWASGLLFLFDPLQQIDLLNLLKDDVDPQVPRMREGGGHIRYDQDVILAEIAGRLRAWRSLGFDDKHHAPLALVLGKHDTLGELFPRDELELDVCVDKKLSLGRIESNSERTREFLLVHCPEIVGSAEAISDNVKYFPASAFGRPAIRVGDQCGPDPESLKPYLVEAPFLWLISQMEPSIIPTSD